MNPDKFFDLIQCESGWTADVYGDKGLAYGLLQFHRDTFDRFNKNYKLKLDYYSPYDQIDLAVRMISDGYGFHWTCFHGG